MTSDQDKKKEKSRIRPRYIYFLALCNAEPRYRVVRGHYNGMEYIYADYEKNFVKTRVNHVMFQLPY